MDNIKMAKKIHKACLAACLECPQYDGRLEYPEIWKSGIVKTIKYWMDVGSIGGKLLWHKGYYVVLPKEIQDVFSKVDTEIDIAINKCF